MHVAWCCVVYFGRVLFSDRTLPCTVNTLHADNLNIWTAFFSIFYFVGDASHSLRVCCCAQQRKSFSIKCVLSYHWSHFDWLRVCVTEWVVIFLLSPVEHRVLCTFSLSLALILYSARCLARPFYLYTSFLLLCYCLFSYFHVCAHRNGMDMLRFYLYRSHLLLFSYTQILHSLCLAQKAFEITQMD